MWCVTRPEVKMQPGSTVTALWHGDDHLDLFATGTDGAVWSTWWGIKAQLYIHWDNPFSGRNKYHVFVDSGWQVKKSGGDGDHARLDIVLRPAVRRNSGFLPSKNGYKFSNHWGDVPYTLPPLRGSFLDYKYGNAANGLCGGMVNSARDYFEANIAIPAQVTAPAGEHDDLFL